MFCSYCAHLAPGSWQEKCEEVNVTGISTDLSGSSLVSGKKRRACNSHVLRSLVESQQTAVLVGEPMARSHTMDFPFFFFFLCFSRVRVKGGHILQYFSMRSYTDRNSEKHIVSVCFLWCWQSNMAVLPRNRLGSQV